MANVLTVVAKIRAAKGKGDTLAALLKEQVAAVRKAEPGCLVYRPHRSTKDPDVFVFYEQYKDDAAFDAHRKSPHLAAYRERREKEGLTDYFHFPKSKRLNLPCQKQPQGNRHQRQNYVCVFDFKSITNLYSQDDQSD